MVASAWSGPRARTVQDAPRPGIETREFRVGSSVLSALDAGPDKEGRFASPNARSAHLGSSTAFVTQSLAGSSKVVKPFEENTWVRAALKAFRGGAEKTELRTLTGRPGDPESKPTDTLPINRLLEDPHPLYTSSEFWGAIVTYYKMDGEGFIFLATTDGKPLLEVEVGTATPGTRKIPVPGQMIPVRGRLVEHKTGKGGMPISYRFFVADKGEEGGSSYSAEFPPECVVNIRDFTPDDPIRGFGDVTALGNEINQYQQVYRYLESSLRSGGDPGAWIIYPNRLVPGELERRQEILDDDATPENSGRTKVIDGEAKVIPNTTTPKDMEYQSYLAWLRDAILACIGVPPPMVGVYDDATYNNISTAEKMMWTGPNGILALLDKIEDVLRHRLFRRLSDPRQAALWPAFDTSTIEALQDDEVELHDKASQIAARGVGVSVNEQLRRFKVPIADAADGEDLQGETAYTAVALQPVVESDDDDQGASPTQSLTGIQMAQMISIVEKVAQGTLPKGAAEMILVTALNIPRDRASEILKDVVEGSVTPPTAPTSPPALSEAGDGDADEGDERSHAPEAERGTGGDPAVSPRPFRRAQTAAQKERLRQWNAVIAKLYDKDGPVASKALVDGIATWFREYRDVQLDKLDAQGTRTAFDKFAEQMAKVQRIEGESDGELLIRVGLTDDDLARMTLNERTWAQRLADLSRSPLEDALRTVLETMQAEGLSPVMNLADPDVIEQLRTQVFRMAEGVTSTTTNRVRNAMIRAMTDRNPDILLTDAIRDALPEIKGSVRDVFVNRQFRANAIARTEVGKAQSAVLLDEMKESGVTKKGWQTSGRANVRDTHAALNGVEIDMDGTYSNGLKHPHDPRGSAAEVINCACSPYAAEIDEDLGIDD